PEPSRVRARLIATASVLALLLAACGASASATAPPPPSPSFGIVQDRPVPAVPLTNQSNQPVSLASFQGKVVVMAPFLSLCQEECPLITGTFISMQRAVKAAGLANKVAFVEVSVDPGRDTPDRLAAYSQQFGADWPMLTGSAGALAQLWKFFGVYVQIVPEGQPPQTDWYTHAPLTYDVAHTDGFILLGPDGNERFITVAAPNVHGQLSPGLKNLLGSSGIQGLNHPDNPNWTVSDALNAVGWLVGRNIPESGA
ncbi:MAG: SCO family protein, partial [Acidimicrobiales bacterium]